MEQLWQGLKCYLVEPEYWTAGGRRPSTRSACSSRGYRTIAILPSVRIFSFPGRNLKQFQISTIQAGIGRFRQFGLLR